MKPIKVYASKPGEIKKLVEGLRENSKEFRRVMKLKKRKKK